MFRRSFALTLLLVGSAAWAQSPASKADDSVRRLSSGRYQDRERAYRELEAIGDDAIESLKKAVQSNEPEVRKRAEDLLLKIEERQTQAKLLAPKRVRLNVTDMPVLDAVAELTKISTYPIQFQGDRTAVAHRKVTLDTGETTFWKAFDALCLKGNLVETTTATPQARTGRVYIGGLRQPVQQGPILVASGTPSASRHIYLGAVRIRLTNATPAKSERPVFSIEATAEPRLQSFQIMHDPVIDRAIDDLGQALIPANAPADRNVQTDDVNIVMMPNGIVQGQSRQSQIRFEPTKKAGSKVALLKGTMSASMQVPDKELVVVKDVMKNVGTQVKGKDGAGMTIVAFDKVGSDYRARIRMDGNQNMGNNGIVFGGAGQVIIQGNVVINNGGFGGQQRSSLPTLTDEKGQAFITGAVAQNGVTINNGNISTEMTVTFRGANLGTPTTLTLAGTRQVALPLPFEYRDLPMRSGFHGSVSPTTPRRAGVAIGYVRSSSGKHRFRFGSVCLGRSALSGCSRRVWKMPRIHLRHATA
ncbi:MAG: hypothetical protein U0744_07925 [Gemmataceae bacterium]